MPFEVTPLIPVVGTVAAALVAGGIARANLIASKETKVSEFRQAWINALRDDLAALFSNVRTLTRAIQEMRNPPDERYAGYAIDGATFTKVRQGAAEAHHRIRLRLNANQPDHSDLRRLLSEMMVALQSYMLNGSVEANRPIDAIETAALAAEGVLKTEWGTVKAGEAAYRDSLRTTKYTLRASFTILALLVLGYPVYYWTASYLETKAANAPAALAAPALAPAAAPATKPAATVGK